MEQYARIPDHNPVLIEKYDSCMVYWELVCDMYVRYPIEQIRERISYLDSASTGVTASYNFCEFEIGELERRMAIAMGRPVTPR